MISKIKNLLFRRHTDSPAHLTRQLTLHLATEEGNALAKAVVEAFGVESTLDPAKLTQLCRWADEFVEVYGPTADALRQEREDFHA